MLDTIGFCGLVDRSLTGWVRSNVREEVYFLFYLDLSSAEIALGLQQPVRRKLQTDSKATVA